VLAEPICDLSTTLLLDDDWDPLTLKSASQDIVPKATRGTKDIRNRKGRELIADIPINDRGTHDIYIDDIIALTVDVPGTKPRTMCRSIFTSNCSYRKTKAR